MTKTDIGTDAYWLAWLEKNQPTKHTGPQPTPTGYLLLALYGKGKRAAKRFACYVRQHDIEVDEWDETTCNLEVITWHCRRCGEGGVTPTR